MKNIALYALLSGSATALIVGALLVFSAAMDARTDYVTDRDRCQRQAVSPYDYHRC